MSESWIFLISNLGAFFMFLSKVLGSVQRKKTGFLRARLLYLAINVAIYSLCGCYSAVACFFMAALRDLYLLKRKKTSNGLYLLIIAAGAAVNLAVALLSYTGFLSLLPVFSFIGFSVGQLLSKTPRQMMINEAVDTIVFWFVIDIGNLLVGCVLTDLYLLLSPLAARVAALDREYYGEEGEGSEAPEPTALS